MDTATLTAIIVAAFITALFGVMGWFIRSVIEDHKELVRDFNNFKVEVAEKYIQAKEFEAFQVALRAEIKDFRESMVNEMRRIFDKLDNKQDKA